MIKIIAAIDGLKYSESTTKYAVDLAGQSGAHLVGIFLDDFTYHSYKIFDVVRSEGLPEKKIKRLKKNDEETRQQAINSFEISCQQARLNYSIHHDKSIAIQELLHESIYADFMVIASKETLTHYEEEVPTTFIRDLLSEVQCPVLVVPREFKPIAKTVLLYDGEPSSVYALRMFSYVLPLLRDLKTEVVSVKSVKQTSHVPDKRLMKEFMKRHYPRPAYTVLKGAPEDEIVSHLKQQAENMLVVLGAYRRGMVSRWFRQSMADILMKELQVPLFIAHNK